MASSGKIPSLENFGYVYWKTRMRAYLLSQGTEIWDMCVHPNFTVLPHGERNTPVIVAQHEFNNKAVNLLFSGLGSVEFERVSHLDTAREIWATLQAHHEGTTQVKARLYQTYRREYENFAQRPGESIDDLFARFQPVINKLRANKTDADQLVSDHEQALKILHTLDPKIWENKVFSIVESASYDTLSSAELFSKLKATEVDS